MREVKMVSILFTLSLILSLNGNEILQKVEEVLNAPQDRVAKVKLTLIDRDGNTKIREIKMWQKGRDKRLIKFLSPADVKGVGFLVLSDEEMYLWMPAFSRIRRIASHIKHQKFMGTDFSYNDIGKSRYTSYYNAKLIKETERIYLLELTPKPDADVAYSRLVMKVSKENWIPIEVGFFDKKLKKIKVMRNERNEEIDGYWVPTRIVMEDLEENHKTVMELIEVQHNLGLSDKIFTKRYLKRAK
jgi:outer membrane lipoprotein-sorting protein